MLLDKNVSEIHSFLKPGNIKPIEKFSVDNFGQLNYLGIQIPNELVRKMHSAYKATMDSMNLNAAMDAIQPTVTTATIPVPIQFLQNWLPGFVRIITAARKIDDLIGMTTTGSWEDQEIVQMEMELTGFAVPYGDYTNVPFTSWNPSYVERTNISFEQGLRVGVKEAKRSARANIDSAAMHRESCALALEIIRNLIGFFGYNNGSNNTYGFLNDPNLPNYVNFVAGASGSTLWSRKTFLEITNDIRTMVATLRNQAQDVIDPETVNMTLGLPTAVVDYLTTTTDFGINVRSWLTQTYPRIRVVSAPELNAANGGANVAYLFADSVQDNSTDDGRVFMQAVPAKFLMLGVSQQTKGYEEDYSNATAGTYCKRPYAVRRYSGC